MRKAAILTIGDELLLGQTVDTNSAWLSSLLDSRGWRVVIKMTVGDNESEIKYGLDQCRLHAELIILTGGLGPTHDDRTVDALTQYFHTRKAWHEDTWQRMGILLGRIGKEPTDMHRRQCFLPEMAEIVLNDHGSAPGMILRTDNLTVVSLPGVPGEMKHLMGDKIIHQLPAGSPIEHRFIRTAGEGETVIAQLIHDIEAELPPDIHLAYLPSFGFVTLRLTTYNPELRDLINLIQERIADRLGKLVYGMDDSSLPKAIGEMLRTRGETIGTGESCTGGYLAHLITSVPGSSDYYMGSVIPYSYELKTLLLDVSEDILLQYGAVSEEVVRLMAEGVREKLNVTWALTTSGIAGPGGATPSKPVGTIWVACSGPNGTKARLLNLHRDRLGNIEFTAFAALILLRKMMMETP